MPLNVARNSERGSREGQQNNRGYARTTQDPAPEMVVSYQQGENGIPCGPGKAFSQQSYLIWPYVFSRWHLTNGSERGSY